MWVGYWYGSPSISSFFFEVCKLKLSKDIHERAEAYRKICESVNYIWPNKDFVMVCARPKAINRNARGFLHSTTGKSIEYPDGWGLYHLNGVRFPKDLWEKAVNRKLSFKEITEIKDIDQRTQAMAFLDVRDFEKLGNVVSECEKQSLDGKKVTYKLLKIPKGMFTVDAYFAIYNCPSTDKLYLSGIDPEIGKKEDIGLAMAWKQSITKDMWLAAIPLKHES